ncbi:MULTISPECIES: hypothetical protein [unclassified Pseudomonas]|uniref:hypothetical protein n=1 Tax=unclassified Pseudomonas TaxID=196821 RepID=UPI00087684CC|nr:MULTISPECIES: hypothetical protein [unclassified Pseudomonas]SCZ35913.1 hypothetical protein SAMN03159405_03463 [Pseudomonas sp. NFACC44-2]SDA68894.1 hypothetical protein SAMN03159429_02823 [Pseudomonas sp. NFACC51]SEJ74946.1 hypothetical protein SAMN03159298_04253 [Pseudomonas sp. NFACC07-1]SFH78453.1 hypothetical protein SAMN03159302_02627 [Pseudomonas sp. NFACC54]SFS83849.1 hypothetical protein SAMN03159306_02281 [Pseudomonas sp. NFACC48-1]
MSNPQDPDTPQAVDNPNDDGFVLGTAGRDEDPNAAPAYAIDRRHDRDELTPEDARGMPGYPEEKPAAKPKEKGGEEAEPGIETPEQGNDKVG